MIAKFLWQQSHNATLGIVAWILCLRKISIIKEAHAQRINSNSK